MSSNHLEQEAAIHSLSTLMSITPTDTYTEFAKVCLMLKLSIIKFTCARVHINSSANILIFYPQHLNNIPDRFEHDKLSENDIQVSVSFGFFLVGSECCAREKGNAWVRLACPTSLSNLLINLLKINKLIHLL